jgi:anaphase-promoting complex subunit 5
MVRYLNPARIGLLALIELYTEEAVPSDAIISVLSFITSHIMDHDTSNTSPDAASLWKRAEKTVSLVISIKDFERVLNTHASVLGLPGRKLWDRFLMKLWEINSLDAMHQFFFGLPRLLAKTKEELRRMTELGEPAPEPGIYISRNSPFGTFIRRSHLEFTRLLFREATELWKDFVRYRQPTSLYLRRRNPSFGRLSFDAVLQTGEVDGWDPGSISALASITYGDMLTSDESSTLPVSTEDIEVLLEFQIEQMQSKHRNHHWPVGWLTFY